MTLPAGRALAHAVALANACRYFDLCVGDELESREEPDGLPAEVGPSV